MSNQSPNNSQYVEPTQPLPETPKHPTDKQPSLGEQEPGAPFSLMFFTYPILVIIAVLALALIYRVW